MAELFKNLYSPTYIDGLSNNMKLLYDKFDQKSFQKAVFIKEWGDMELKQRMRYVSTSLHQFLPNDYQYQLDILIRYLEMSKHSFMSNESLVFMFIPDFVEVFGMDEYELSVSAMEEITKYTSCEFAVRPFIIKYEDKMILQMKDWANHKDARVRRLASEGCRPRLPWAMALPKLKKDPSPILSILEQLKDDEDEWVRRSVANNVNDIAKDNPEIVIRLIKDWKGRTKTLDWVVKHAARTLLKQGDREVLNLFGFANVDDIKLDNLKVNTPKVKIGEALQFQFALENQAESDVLLRLEYGLYYKKANGDLSRKVFKISEKEYKAGATIQVERKQSFKPITTRKFYPGYHEVSVILNGEEKDKVGFELLV